MTKQKKDDGDITLIDVINHTSHQFALLRSEMNSRFQKVDARLSKLEQAVEKKLDASEFRAFAKGVDDLDFRVQEIEEDMPVIKDKLNIS